MWRVCGPHHRNLRTAVLFSLQPSEISAGLVPVFLETSGRGLLCRARARGSVPLHLSFFRYAISKR